MKVSERLIEELQKRLKVGNRRGVHLNGIPGKSRYKFDIHRLSHISESMRQEFINDLLTKLPLNFTITWKDNVGDLNALLEEDQINLVKISRSIENLINQTDTIASETGINTFGFGFPMLIRRDQKDRKLTVAPILIWSLQIKKTKEYNTWKVIRKEDDPIYVNEVLINHFMSDSETEISGIPDEMLEDGIIDHEEWIRIMKNSMRDVVPKFDSKRMAKEYYELIYDH